MLLHTLLTSVDCSSDAGCWLLVPCATGNILDVTKPVDKQLQSLLKIKAFIDTTGVLKEWTKDGGADGGYCNWQGAGYYTHLTLPTKRARQYQGGRL